MDFDLISFILGAVAGVAGSAVVGRSKFAELQDRVRQAEDKATILLERAKTQVKTTTRKR